MFKPMRWRTEELPLKDTHRGCSAPQTSGCLLCAKPALEARCREPVLCQLPGKPSQKTDKLAHLDLTSDEQILQCGVRDICMALAVGQVQTQRPTHLNPGGSDVLCAVGRAGTDSAAPGCAPTLHPPPQPQPVASSSEQFILSRRLWFLENSELS